MALTTGQCNAFNQFLFRRVPDWDKELAKDRFPTSQMYSQFYTTKPWPSFTGTTHTWDKVHVTRPNDDGNWSTMSADPCIGTPCAPDRKYAGWGSTRNTYVKYNRDYQSPVFCFDQLRNIEEAEAQLAAIIDGLKDYPEGIVSDFIRKLVVAQANVWFSAGAADVQVTPAFTADPTIYSFGSDANLPTSKLNMGYLDNHIENLQYAGYFDRMLTPDGTFLITSDIQTHRELTVRNPDLVRMYNGADFKKGGLFFNYGLAMSKVGNWSFKIDPEPLRAQRVSVGNLQRIWAYDNVPATVGRKPAFATAYKNAQYQMYHVYNKAAREIFTGETTPVNPQMKFDTSRNLMGKWSWKSPDYFTALDPASGVVCPFNNDKKNMGYFLAEFEYAAKSTYPEIEMVIWAQREPQAIIDTARCAATPASAYQIDLYPYNGADCSI